MNDQQTDQTAPAVNRLRPIYKELATVVAARLKCIEINNEDWQERHERRIDDIIDTWFPHGSGFDRGTTLDLETSNSERLVFHADFHHMDENCYYDGWTEHKIIVTPSLQFGYRLRVTGRNKRDIKSYIEETFDGILDHQIEMK